MSHAYAARGARQPAVLAAIVGLHFAVILVIALGLEPRALEIIFKPEPITPPKEPEKELVVEPPTGNYKPGVIEIVVSEPVIDIQVDEEPTKGVTASTGVETGSAGEAGTIQAVAEYVPPSLRTRPASLSALINACYPAASRRLNEEGTVLALVAIGANGSAASWSVAQSSGFPRLDAAIACVLGKLDFVAGRRDGQAVSAEALLPIVFKLD